MRKINQAGLDLIKNFEKLCLAPYICPAGKPTIGYGSTYYEDGSPVSISDPRITESRAESLLIMHLETSVASIEKHVKVPLTDNQFAALCSFIYNIGIASFTKSTLLKKLNTKDYVGAAGEFERWNKAKGQILSGLTRRRQAEKALFLQSPTPQKTSNMLNDGPSNEEIEVKLIEIEKEIL